VNPEELLSGYASTPVYGAPDYEPLGYEDTLTDAAPKAFVALRAVLDLHVEQDDGYCTGCSDVHAWLPVPVARLIPWPCPTVRAIGKALEVEP
jgi:hypothetical protein